MAKTAMTALLALALAGCATIKAKHDKPAATAPAAGAKLAEVTGVAFAPGRARLSDEGRAEVDQALHVLQQHPDVKVAIEGHTDAKGPAKANQTLSERRARAVASYLREQGIAADRLSVRGYGETRPIADNKSEAGRSRNRRVEIVVQ